MSACVAAGVIAQAMKDGVARASADKLRDPLAYVRTKMWHAKFLPFVHG